MTMNNYTYPTTQLLTYGECDWASSHFKKWPNYLELGFTTAHVTELVQMAIDKELFWGDSEDLATWAPVHAWRTLAQLHAEAAITPLMSLFSEEDDWITEELPVVYGLIGVKAIPALAEYLGNKSHGVYPRINAAYSLERIGNTYSEARIACVLALTQQLEKFAHNDPELNGFLMTYLANLKAIESLATIRQAYNEDCVDCTIMGDLEDVEIDLGLRDHRSHPPTYPSLAEKYGLVPAQRDPIKLGRNDPCPCGSGKKYKKCCLNRVVREKTTP
jgi:hypothetical protein